MAKPKTKSSRLIRRIKRKKPWYRNPTWLATAAGIVLAIPVCFSGVNYVVSAIEEHGAKSVHIQESQKQLDENTTDVMGLKTAVQQIDNTLQAGDQKLTAISDSLNEVRVDLKKQSETILWFLKRTYSDQSRVPTTEPSLAKRERGVDDPEEP
jgi:septal ring factor EnvC (AmiA/AmiB activator)